MLSLLVMLSGAVTGLVVITPASGFVEPMPALFMGLVGGAVCYWSATTLKRALGYDDSLDAFGVHGVGGIVGALLTGVFATSAVTGSALPDMMTQFSIQAASVIAILLYGGLMSALILIIIDFTIGLRVTPEEELTGLDLTQHGERLG